jgi:hypothetical protein
VGFRATASRIPEQPQGTPMKGLFNKIKNGPTRQRFVVSTIKKTEDLFETAVFEANILYIPRNLSKPVLAIETHTQDEAWDTHYLLASRLTQEHPVRVFAEYRP